GDANESDAGTNGSDSDASEADSAEAGSEGSEGSGGQDLPPEGLDVPARGIWLEKVEASQGVAIDIGRDGQWVGPESRNSRLLRDRNLLIRGFWAFEDGWELRPIEARLTLIDDAGVETEIRQVVDIEGASAPGD